MSARRPAAAAPPEGRARPWRNRRTLRARVKPVANPGERGFCVDRVSCWATIRGSFVVRALLRRPFVEALEVRPQSVRPRQELVAPGALEHAADDDVGDGEPV